MAHTNLVRNVQVWRPADIEMVKAEAARRGMKVGAFIKMATMTWLSDQLDARRDPFDRAIESNRDALMGGK